MRSLESRLNRVVRTLHKAAAECRVCGGAEARVMRVRIYDEPEVPVEPCPACRRIPEVYRLIIPDGDVPAVPAPAS
jgi:hypothetical protein